MEEVTGKNGFQAEGIQPVTVHLESEDEFSDYEECSYRCVAKNINFLTELWRLPPQT